MSYIIMLSYLVILYRVIRNFVMPYLLVWRRRQGFNQEWAADVTLDMALLILIFLLNLIGYFLNDSHDWHERYIFIICLCLMALSYANAYAVSFFYDRSKKNDV